VHPVTLRESIWRAKFSVSARVQELIEYAVEVWYIVASALFVVGSANFIPGHTREERVGCRVYDIGSAMFSVGSCYYLAETIWLRENTPVKRRYCVRCCLCCRKRTLDQILYFVGSLIFLLGTLIWDPDFYPWFEEWESHVAPFTWQAIADFLFMLGSLMFSFAAFCTALDIHKVHNLFKGYALVITTCYEFGGFFFIAGTMAFVPGYDCRKSLQTLGAWMYLVGSLLYFFGSVLSLLKCVATFQVAKEHLHAAQMIQVMWRRKHDSDDLESQGSSKSLVSQRAPSRKALNKMQQAAMRLQRVVREKRRLKEVDREELRSFSKQIVKRVTTRLHHCLELLTDEDPVDEHGDPQIGFGAVLSRAFSCCKAPRDVEHRGSPTSSEDDSESESVEPCRGTCSARQLLHGLP